MGGLMKKIVLLSIVVMFVGCQTPIGKYGPTTEVVATSSDYTFTAQGQDTMKATVDVDVVTKKGSGSLPITVEGAKQITSKGQMWNSITTGRAKSIEAIHIGQYSGQAGGGSGLNLSISEGGSGVHDLVRGRGTKQEKASVPEYNFDNATHVPTSTPDKHLDTVGNETE